MIYLWSDTHFNHRGIIGYCNRPYLDVEAMNKGLIERWNEAVKPADTIWLLGDFGFGNMAALSGIFAQLQGHKRLVIGNHDERNQKVMKLPWEAVEDLVTLREESVRAVACHYPLETWKQAHHGYLHVHGHSHGTLQRKLPHRYDVGADVEWTPVSLQTLAERAKAEVFVGTDHHRVDL